MSVKLSQERYACVTWEVRDFFKLLKRRFGFIESPRFFLTDEPHILRLYPNLCVAQKGNMHFLVAFHLLRFPSYVSEVDTSFKIGYKSITGKTVETEKQLVAIGVSELTYLFTASRSIFENEKETYVPEGTLTVFCRMRLGELGSTRTLQSEVGETSFVDRVLASDQNGEHGGLPSVDKLQADYKHLLLKRTESDTCLVVCGKEFKVHRNILRARSPVFDAMFDNETAEKKSGRVVIDDLDPESFSEFLEYVYTGRVEAFSNDNAFGVYVAADRYQLHTLKSMCVEYMRKNMSVDSFCDVMTLALKHNETNLVEQAAEFFKKNLPRIISTVKWQQFMIENSTGVNELLLKSFVPGE